MQTDLVFHLIVKDVSKKGNHLNKRKNLIKQETLKVIQCGSTAIYGTDKNDILRLQDWKFCFEFIIFITYFKLKFLLFQWKVSLKPKFLQQYLLQAASSN